MKRGHLQSYGVVLLWKIALATSLYVVVHASNPPEPVWEKDRCGAGFSYCSNVTTKESWSGEGNMVYFSLHAIADFSDFFANSVNVWYVGENFQASWASGLFGKNFNVVRFSPRGSEFAYPQIRCDVNYYDNSKNCWPDISCAEQIARSGLRLEHFSITETANDLAWVLKTLGKGNQNVVVAEGIGSFVVQRMLGLHDNLTNVSVIMAGFGHPQYFDIFESIKGYDNALQNLLHYCDKGEMLDCPTRVGAVEGMWDRFVNVMTAAELNRLKCNSLLDWGVAPEKMHLKYLEVIAVLLKKPQHFLMGSRWELAQLIPSFLYRLQRCNGQDVVALNQLYTFVKSTPTSQCPAFIPQRYNWLVNELTLTPPEASPEELLQEAGKVRYLLPSITTVQSLYDFYKAFPKYDVTDRSVKKTSMLLLLILSDLDPVFPYSTSTLAVKAYQAQYRFLPHQSDYPVTTTAAHCIDVNLEYFRTNLRWAKSAACTQNPSYNFDFIRLDAQEFYGTRDAWDFTLPNPPENVSKDTPEPPDTPCQEGKECSNKGKTVLAFLFAFTLLALIGVGYLYWRKSRAVGFSDDFYANLNH